MNTTKPREILCYVKKKNATCGGRKSMMIRLAKVAGRACRKSDVAIVLQNETGTTRPLQDDEKNIRLTATPQVEIKQKKINQKQNHSNVKTKIRMPTICMSTDDMHVNSTRNPAMPTKKKRRACSDTWAHEIHQFKEKRSGNKLIQQLRNTK